MVSAEHAERTEKFLTLLKASVFVSSWLHFSVSSASSALDVVAAYATMPPVP